MVSLSEYNDDSGFRVFKTKYAYGEELLVQACVFGA